MDLDAMSLDELNNLKYTIEAQLYQRRQDEKEAKLQQFLASGKVEAWRNRLKEIEKFFTKGKTEKIDLNLPVTFVQKIDTYNDFTQYIDSPHDVKQDISRNIIIKLRPTNELTAKQKKLIKSALACVEGWACEDIYQLFSNDLESVTEEHRKIVREIEDCGFADEVFDLIFENW